MGASLSPLTQKNKKSKSKLKSNDTTKNANNKIKIKSNYTKKFLDAIKNQETVLMLERLTLKDVNKIQWDLLLKCTTVIELNINYFPSPKKRYTPYLNTEEWCLKPPENIHNIFPMQVFEIKNLTTLNISGYPYSYVPDNIGKLTNLQVLDITSSPIICLPKTIGKLRELKKIDFYCSRRMRYVPYEILYCTNLISTKMGTSGLYCNYKNNLLLPPLPKIKTNIISNMRRIYHDIFNIYGLTNNLIDIIIDYLSFIECSNIKCQNMMFSRECIHYGWSRQNPGGDVVCLLAEMCSKQCINSMKNGTRVYLGKVNDLDPYENLKITYGVDDDNVKIELLRKEFRNCYDKPVTIISKELEQRFEYFWKYNLRINYNNYHLVHDSDNEIKVVFDD